LLAPALEMSANLADVVFPALAASLGGVFLAAIDTLFRPFRSCEDPMQKGCKGCAC
jgi:hypothetical protein